MNPPRTRPSLRGIRSLSLSMGLVLALTPVVAATTNAITPSTATDTAIELNLSGDLSHEGQVELFWDESDPAAGIVSYTVHRQDSGSAWSPSQDNQVATVGAYYTMELPLPLSYGDFGVAAHTDYEYVVVARDEHGNALGSDNLTITTGDRLEDQQAVVFYAYRTGTPPTTQVRWSLPAHDDSGTVTLYGSRTPAHAAGSEDAGGQWDILGTYAADAGEAELSLRDAARYQALRLESSSGDSGVDARVRVDNGPRLLVTEERLAEIRDLVNIPGTTHARTLDLMKQDIADAERWVYPNSTDPRISANSAAYAALVNLITGDQEYADIAFDRFMATAEQINNGTPNQPLFAGAYSTELALAYDWSRETWSAEQRQQARTVLLRLASWWTTTHYINDLPIKSSNWVGITRGGETVLRLALLGEPGYVDDTARLSLTIDHLKRNLSDGFAANGYAQEGLAYWIYGMREVAPAVRALDTFGIDAVKAELSQHDWTGFVMHALSLQDDGYRLQMGVDPGLNNSHQFAGEFVSETLALAGDEDLGAVRWMYDHVTGVDSNAQDFGSSMGRDLTLLYYPEHVEPSNPSGHATASSASMDEEAGAFLFRNRYEDENDVLLGTFNRNTDHPGWSGLETFGLPILAHGERWTVMAAKNGNARQPHQANTRRMSKPLVDGEPEYVVGEGRTLAAERYDEQGGGYVELDASGNYEVAEAHRRMVVDMQDQDDIDAVVAIHDSFADETSRTWTWQLAGLRPETGPAEDGLLTFAFARNGAWVKGWVVPHDGIDVSTDSRLVQVERAGETADFQIILAIGSGPEPTASADGSLITVGEASYDLDALAEFRP